MALGITDFKGHALRHKAWLGQWRVLQPFVAVTQGTPACPPEASQPEAQAG